jgi:predicted O-linked N-acetylglucosamine transferase (SPINDLY family)
VLWAGLPLLTCAGEAFSARMGGSLLRAIGLPELITYSLGDYEKRALDLSADHDELSRLRMRLGAHRMTASLFGTERYCRHLEAAYLHIRGRARQGLPPSDYRVEPAAD